MKMMKLLLIFALVVGPSAWAHHTPEHKDDSPFNGLKSLIKKAGGFFEKIQNKFSLRGSEEEGPEPAEHNWGGLCSTGTKQSPIDFKQSETEVANNVNPLRFSGFSESPLSTNVTHGGDTVKVFMNTAQPITVTGGVFGDDVYQFQQLHFHWGKNSHEGSEHTVESRRFPLECHLVFYKSNSAGQASAAAGMAVLGVHFEGNWRSSSVLNPIIKAVKKMEVDDRFQVIAGGNPLRSYLPENTKTYFTYIGSLTTPPCTEGVTWVWFTDKLQVANHQLNTLKELTDESGNKVTANFRGIQQLNGRQVYLVNPQ